MTGINQLQPLDEHNLRLEENVHPRQWTNPTPEGKYNLVVIGAGTAGLVTAAGAAGLGAKVALIERELMGGDCLNVGCVPSKGLIGAARVAATVRDAAEFGVNVPDGVDFDFAKMMGRMRKLRADISPDDSAARFKDLGIDVFFGTGKFVDSETVSVDGTELKFKNAVIATGARAAAPPIPGLDQVDYLTNETVFSLTELPAKLGVIGAGPIGCELAQSFARFGSAVYLVENSGHVLPREDEDAALIVQEQLKKDGVNLLCCGRDLKVEPSEDGKIRLNGEAGNGKYNVVVDKLLVAVGRAPNVNGLDLDQVAVEFDKQGVKVNDRLQTTNPKIYAAGDICSKYKFTHSADFLARIVIQNTLFKGRAKASSLIIPWATYTSPEIAHVGLYPQDAKEKGIEIDTYTKELSEIHRAILEGTTDGFVKVHCRKGTDTIVGATIVGENAGDMISEITLAMVANSKVSKIGKFLRLAKGVGLGTLSGAIHPYPTVAESIRLVGDQYNRTKLTPFVKSLFNKWLAWSRK